MRKPRTTPGAGDVNEKQFSETIRILTGGDKAFEAALLCLFGGEKCRSKR